MKTNRLLTSLAMLMALLMFTACVTTRKTQTDSTATEVDTMERIENTMRTDTANVVEQLIATNNKSEKTTSEVLQTDTTRITQRIIDVEVDLPQANIQRETPDTTSVLETDLYKSIATWSNGKLTHSLISKPNAKVKGKAVATDTTSASRHSANYRQETYNSESDSLIHQTDTKSTETKETSDKQQEKTTNEVTTIETITTTKRCLLSGVASVAAIALAAYIIYRYRRRRTEQMQE